MTEQAAQTVEQTTTADTSNEVPSFDERIAQAKQKANAVGEATAQSLEELSTAQDKSKTAPAAEDETAKAKAERQARLNALKEEERKKVEVQHGRRERERLEREAQEAQQLRVEKQKYEATFKQLESALKDPDQFLNLAEHLGLDPTALSKVIVARIQDPARAAESKLRGKFQQQLSPVEQQMQAMAEEIERLKADKEMQAQVAVIQQAQTELLASVREASRVSPLSAAFLERHGSEEFISLADRVAANLPEGCGLQAVHDAIEDLLERFQIAGGQPVSNAKSKSTPNAAAKATPITNSLAASRTTIEEEEDLSQLSFEERVERAKSSARTSR